MRIDFYHHVTRPLPFCCRLIQTAWQRGSQLMVLVPDSAQCQALDQLLWTFQPQAFIPHCAPTAAYANQTPIWLATELPPVVTGRVLLNLRLSPLPEAQQFERILQIASADEAELAQARQVARHYKQLGAEIVYHDMTGRG